MRLIRASAVCSSGHSHFVSDVFISSDGQFALSDSCDGTFWFWDLTTVGDFSSDNPTNCLWLHHQVVECTVQHKSHSEWVSYVCFSSSSSNPIIISCGWDKLVKVWNQGSLGGAVPNCKRKTNHIGHTDYLHTVTVCSDGSLCASGGKDGQAMLWDLNKGKWLSTPDGGDIISALYFSPDTSSMLPQARHQGLDLEGKTTVDELKQEVISTSSRVEPSWYTSLAGSADGQTVCLLHGQPGMHVAGDHQHPLEIYGRALEIKKNWFSNL
ncbi:unnamed protein product [Nyctereutes procyonoides]|uniref:Small ribosomal subunit protein RACK1 n=1 Tax=Nyctereutes procyonoides TaxID=34880 RepID=A0A811ZR06_NYCPR|nr:unnamed protein product [Nyctereutes procyonoides]